MQVLGTPPRSVQGPLATALVLLLNALGPATCQGQGSEPDAADRAAAARGRQLIVDHRFLPQDFHQSTFDELWRDWPEPLRQQAERCTLTQRRLMSFARYGFTPRADDPSKPMQYVVDDQGWWAMNCFACHMGNVAGTAIEGAPNSQIALQTLYEDLRRTKQRLKIPLGSMDLGSLVVPMGSRRGVTNAVMFGVALMAFRDRDLNLKPFPSRPVITNHDMDPPAWWNIRYRQRLYIDGFVQKTHRALVPFAMDQRTDGETMRGWETQFQDIYAYIHSLEAPTYPFEVDRQLAEEGRAVFEANCAECHGQYGESVRYPGIVVPIGQIGTDRVRLDALTVVDRENYRNSWLARYGLDETTVSPRGYQPPPLRGVWASAPYLHNGSVPTLWHLLNPSQRPTVWRRTSAQYDRQKIGLTVETLERIPPETLREDELREFYDTGQFGGSAQGHIYPEKMTPAERTAVLEYLKTL